MPCFNTAITTTILILLIIFYTVNSGSLQPTKLENQNALDFNTNANSHEPDNNSPKNLFSQTTANKSTKEELPQLIGIRGGPFNWLPSLPTIGINQNLSLQVNAGITSSKPKPFAICPDRLCPYPDYLCDLSCRDYGKSGGRFAFRDTETGDRRLSCLCHCDAPRGSVPSSGTISPCRDSNICDNLCKNKRGTQYPLGGSCVRNVCQCGCGIDEAYDLTSPFCSS